MFDYDEESKKAAEILDKYNLTDMLKEYRGIEANEIKEEIKKINDELCEAMESLTYEEFCDYLVKRYRMRMQEVSINYMWWNDKDGRFYGEWD